MGASTLMLVAGVAASGVDVERLFVYVYAMDYRLAARHEEAITAALGPSGRMIGNSKTTYRDTHLDHLPVFNANVCLGSSKVWHGDVDLTIDEEALLDLASRSGEVVSVLYESDGRFRYEDHPLIAEAVYSAAPSGHSLVDSTWAERRADGRLYHRTQPRPPRWRRPTRPRLWRFWSVSAECQRSSAPEGTQTLRLVRIGEHTAPHKSPLFMLGLHTWSRDARGAWVEWTWNPSSHRAWAPQLRGRLKLHGYRVRPYVGVRVASGLAYEVRAGFVVGASDLIWG